MACHRHLVAVLAVVFATFVAAQSQQPAQPAPPRDTPARQAGAVATSGTISGHVLAADTGRPVSRARVFITAPDLPQGRGMLTDDSGVFQFGDLPAGRYSVMASKTGFLTLSFGQRRPLQ